MSFGFRVRMRSPGVTSTVHRLLSDRLLCWKEPTLASYPSLGLLRTATLMYVVDNSLKWALFNIVSGQIASDALEVERGIFIENLADFFLFLRAVVNIPIQTLIILPWLFFRKMIITQLELGPPVSRLTVCKSFQSCKAKKSLKNVFVPSLLKLEAR